MGGRFFGGGNTDDEFHPLPATTVGVTLAADAEKTILFGSSIHSPVAVSVPAPSTLSVETPLLSSRLHHRSFGWLCSLFLAFAGKKHK